MIIINDNYIRNEFDALNISLKSIDSAEQSFEIDLGNASEIIMLIDTEDISDDVSIIFDAGTGAGGRPVGFVAKSYSTSLAFLSSGEIANSSGKAHFKLETSADLSSNEIKIGIVKKLFARNN